VDSQESTKLLTLHTNIMEVANTLAYHDTATNTSIEEVRSRQNAVSKMSVDC